MLTSAPTSEQLLGHGVRTQRVSSSAVGDLPVFRFVQAADGRSTGSMPVWGRPETVEESVSQKLSASTSKLSSDTHMAMALAETPDAAPADEGFGFLDFIDMVNPLQHLPVVGSVYRSMTGDQIKPVSQIIGGAAFGGIWGAVSGVANAVITAGTGRDIGQNLVNSVFGQDDAASADSDTTIALSNLAARPRSPYNE